MPFLGKQPTAGFASIVKDDLTPDGSTTAFTLSKQVANANDIAVFLGNVRQEPTDAYTVSGTTLTMSAAPAIGLNFYVLHIAGTVESSVVPADDTISTAKIQTSAVTAAKIASLPSTSVGTSQLATGLDLTGKVTTGYETLGNHVASEAWSGIGYTTSGYFVTLGSLTIPKPGIWRVSTQMRIRWSAADYFAKIYLTTSSQSGSSGTIADEIYAAGQGANTACRMLYERITVNGFGNILLEPSWIIDVPTGLTSGDTIYFSIFPNGGDSLALNNNDANGRIGAHGIKIAETTTSGSTITTRGF